MTNYDLGNVQVRAGMNLVDIGDTNIVVDLLNDLIVTNRGIIQIYQTAMVRLENDVNAGLLQSYVDQHKTFLSDLINVVVHYGGDPAEDSTGSSLVKQAWVTLKAALTEGDGPILMVAANDAETVMEAYAEAMSADLPDDARDVIREHMSKTRLAYEKLSALSAAYNSH